LRKNRKSWILTQILWKLFVWNKYKKLIAIKNYRRAFALRWFFYCNHTQQLLLCGINADAFAVATNTLKLYLACFKSKKCIVAAAAYIDARVNLCAALTDKDVTGKYSLAIGALNAKALGLTVASVLCGTDALFMCEMLH
jgi:hypothetical protein